MRLLAVEVRRILSRSLVIASVLVTLGAVGLVLAGTWQSAQPLSPAQVEAAQEEYERALADWEEYGPDRCFEDEERARERGELAEGESFGCEHMEPPREEWFVPMSSELTETFVPLLSTTAMLFFFLAYLIGATSTAAEISSGTLSTWLTFVPQRMRVLFSKIGAAAVVALPVTAGLTAVLAAGLYGVHAANDALGDMTGEVWADAGWVAARIVVLGVVIAGVGAALGVLLRHTAAALGVVIGWFIVVESIIGGLVPRLQPFMLRLNVQAWVADGAPYWVMTCEVTERGTECIGVEHTVSLAHGAVFLGVVALVVLLVTALVFRRRDVG